MKRRELLQGVAVGAAGLALANGSAQAQQAVRLRIQTAVPSASIYFELLKRMGERVDKMSAGRIKMEILPDGAVVPAFEILDAVDKGIVEGGYAWAHYWSGKNPAAGLFSNPMAGAGVGLDQISHVAWIFEGGGYDLYRKLYADVLKVKVEPLFVQPMGPDPLGWFKRPIASTADFKKLKYRSPPGITGEIFKEMGVAAVAMPGGEIVPAAQRGVIDAAEWIGPPTTEPGLQTVWKITTCRAAPVHRHRRDADQQAVWDKLAPDLRRSSHRGDGVDDRDVHVQRLPQRAGDRAAAQRVQGQHPRHAEGLLPRVRPRDQRRAGSLRREGRVLQGSARLAAQLREGRPRLREAQPGQFYRRSGAS
jgi:TRAP-type mannitol/chloroaromatic compound transport system substrate-binding protein